MNQPRKPNRLRLIARLTELQSRRKSHQDKAGTAPLLPTRKPSGKSAGCRGRTRPHIQQGSEGQMAVISCSGRADDHCNRHCRSWHRRKSAAFWADAGIVFYLSLAVVIGYAANVLGAVSTTAK